MDYLNIDQRETIGYNFLMNEMQIHTPYGFEVNNKLKPYIKEDKDLLIKDLNDLEILVKKFKEQNNL
ncbi:MAG: hypothetical protein DRO88_13775, partial [Promethearchaeia archaeon]